MEISERIEYFIGKNKYDEALNLCKSKDLDYLKQIVTGYLEDDKLDSVMKKISNSFKFYNNRDLQYSIVKRLMTKGQPESDDAALEICNRDVHKLDDDMQYKAILIYIKKEEYEKALEICNNQLLKRSEKIQYGKIMVLSILKRYDEIRTICEDETFKDSILIQYPYVELLEEAKEYEKALEICLNPKFCSTIEFISKEKTLKEKITEISNKEASDIRIKEIETINVTPLVQPIELEKDGLSTQVTKKKKEKEYKVKVKTIYDSYEEELITLGTYYLRGLLNLDEPSFDKYAAALGTKMKIASDKRKGYDTGKTLSYEENLAITKYEKYMEKRKKIISAIDNIKYLEEQPITDQKSLAKVLSLISTYKSNIDKNK